jgi:translocation and assembly module TamB
MEFNSAKYITKFNLKELLLKLKKEEDSVPFKFSDSLNLLLDIDLLTRDKLAFQSNLADLDLKGKIRLTGSLKNPIVVGSLDLEKGELRYYNRKFSFTRGRVDFIDPNRFRPYYDFEALGEINKYKIKMISYGTPQQFNLNLYSDPPLSQVDILSLLSVGMTSADVRAGKVSLSSAPSYLANRISEKLSRGIQKTTGLDTFEVTPILEGSQGDKGVGIVTKKSLTQDLTVTYRSDMATISNDQIIEMEYRLTDNISLVGMNSRGSSGGVEIKFSFAWD